MNEGYRQNNTDKIAKVARESSWKLYEIDVNQSPINVLKVKDTKGFP